MTPRFTVDSRHRAAVALAALSLLALTACTPVQGDAQSGSSSSTSSSAVASQTASSAGSTSAAADPQAEIPVTTFGASSTAGWKSFSTPDGRASFDLPQDWTMSSKPGVDLDGKGSRLYVLTPPDLMKSRQLFFLVTDTPQDRSCTNGTQPLKYTVLESTPMDLPSDPGADKVSPRFVYRVIEGGGQFQGSFAVTDTMAGADYNACVLDNAVHYSPVGYYTFADGVLINSAAIANGSYNSFDSLDAAKAFQSTPEYQTLRSVIMSLKVKP
ncbi:hypothetical protein [Psychromicrobium xiongbiense]|uniref:hypothetical protein n=1 Tax=Psychromicrobium xiongbiense TaxID=3051184 RepID=UPI0025576564|nr:hypothetical protein [Psychromicrobium sp. YIM S02556]